MEQAIARAQEMLQQRRRQFENGQITSEQMMQAEVEVAELVARLSAGQQETEIVADRARLSAQAANVRAALERAEFDVRRMRELQNRGLIGRAQAAQTEQQLAELRNQLRVVEREAESRGRQAEVVAGRARMTEQAADVRAALERAELDVRRTRELQDRGLISRAQVVQTERQLVEVRNQLRAVERAAESRGLAPRDQARDLPRGVDRASLEYAFRLNQAGELEIALGDDVVVLTDADTRVQERDVVVIQISGETRLPTTYEVDTDGAIRLPLLGLVQVRGLTIAQVRTAVSNMLADRQLAGDATVTVTVRRPRTPESGR
jgi:hypothetical protein